MVGNVSLRVACSHLTASEQDDSYLRVISTICTLAAAFSLSTSVSQYKIESVYVTPQSALGVFPMLGVHVPGDLAVYISHSNSFLCSVSATSTLVYLFLLSFLCFVV